MSITVLSRVEKDSYDIKMMASKEINDLCPCKFFITIYEIKERIT